MTSEFVTLKGGLIVPADAIDLALRLESQGFTLAALEDGTLRLRRLDGQEPASMLTAEDRDHIVRRKQHLMALAAYIDERERGENKTPH